MEPLKVAFLWHQHQPNYRDPGKKIFLSDASYGRKFYYPPSVTLERGYDLVFMGTGNREDSCGSGSADRIYAVKDDHSATTLQETNLVDLTDAAAGPHLLASAGMLESERHHREYKLVKADFNHRKTWTSLKTEYPTGDIIVSNGKDYYSVFGMPVTRGDTFNPRDGYALSAKTKSANGWTSKWAVQIPITGKAMVLAGDTVFVAGAPLVFDDNDLPGTYAGRRGGVLWAVSARDGTGQAKYTLDVLPTWDGMAAAYGRLFIVNQDGSIDCWGTE